MQDIAKSSKLIAVEYALQNTTSKTRNYAFLEEEKALDLEVGSYGGLLRESCSFKTTSIFFKSLFA